MTEQPKPSKNPFNNLSRKTLTIAGSAAAAFLFLCCGTCGIFAIISGRAAKADFVQGNALWDKGDKAGGAAKYRDIIDKHDARFIDAADYPRLYGRVIDFEFENGRGDSGKAYMDKAEKKGVTPMLSNAEAKAMVAAIQAEKARIEGEKAEQKRLADAKKAEKNRLDEAKKNGEMLTADFYPFKKGTVQHTMAILYFSKAQMQSRREYTHDGDAIITMRYLEQFTVPGFNNVALPKPRKMHHREKDGFIVVGDPPDADLLKEAPALAKVEGFSDITWHPIIRIRAVVGDEWDHSFGTKSNPTLITERYKLVKLSVEEVRNKMLKEGESPEKHLIALIERQTKTTVDVGKVMENVEEIRLGKGIGPVSWRSFRIEDGRRIQNWGENIAPVLKK